MYFVLNLPWSSSPPPCLAGDTGCGGPAQCWPALSLKSAEKKLGMMVNMHSLHHLLTQRCILLVIRLMDTPGPQDI